MRKYQKVSLYGLRRLAYQIYHWYMIEVCVVPIIIKILWHISLFFVISFQLSCFTCIVLFSCSQLTLFPCCPIEIFVSRKCFHKSIFRKTLSKQSKTHLLNNSVLFEIHVIYIIYHHNHKYYSLLLKSIECHNYFLKVN